MPPAIAPPKIPPLPVRPANPRVEYVASGHRAPGVGALYQSLPRWIDDCSRDFGDDLYERMALDAQISACAHMWKTGVLAQRITVSPNRSEDDADFPQADEIARFCARLLLRVRGLRTKVLYDMLEAFLVGNRVAEKVWEEVDRGPDKGRWTLRRLRVKPRRSYAFVVDPFLEVVGLLAAIPGQAFPYAVYLPSPKTLDNLLPRDKFAVLTYREHDSDPRGVSAARAAYDPWWFAQQCKPEYLKYLARFGSPSLVGTLSEHAGVIDVLDPETLLPMVDGEGNPVQVQATDQMREALEGFQNGTIVVLPFGAKVTTLEPLHTGSLWTDAFNHLDRQKIKALLWAPLAIDEGEHQTRAATGDHRDAVGLHIQYGRTLTEDMLEADILEQAIEINFGADALEWLPEVSLGDVEARDLAAMMAAVAKLETAGYLTDEQRKALDSQLGLPPRTAEDMAEEPAPGGPPRPEGDEEEEDEEEENEE